MATSIIRILKLALIIAVLTSLFFIVFLILDVISNEDFQEFLSKSLLIIGAMTLASIVIIFIVNLIKSK